MSRSPFRYSQQLMRCAVLTVASAAFMAGLFSTAASAFDAAALDRAKLATIGVLEDTQDQRTPDKPGKILVRGTGFHLRDGYIVTARHAAEKQDVTTGTVIQKQIHVLTTDLHEIPADLVGDSAFMDVVVYRVAEAHRAKLLANVSFAPGDVQPGQVEPPHEGELPPQLLGIASWVQQLDDAATAFSQPHLTLAAGSDLLGEGVDRAGLVDDLLDGVHGFHMTRRVLSS